jgi:hypothetical protein
MTDLGSMSTEELQSLYQPQQPVANPMTIPGQNGEPARVIMEMGKSPDLSKMSTEELQAAYNPSSFLDTAKDVVHSAITGVGKGLISLAGMPADLKRYADKGLDEYVVNPILRATGQSEYAGYDSPVLKAMGSENIRKGVEAVTGPLHDPETTPGHYAETIGEFVPAAMGGPQSLARKFILQAAIPGAASEGAGQYFKDTPYEPWARFGAGVGAGIGGALINGPSTAEHALASKLPSHVTDAHIAEAQNIIDRGRALNDPVTVTGPEALSKVTGRNVLLDQQRLAENAGQSRAAMEAALGGRSAAFEQSARSEIGNTFGPGTNNPSMIGADAKRAAESTLTDVNSAINRATKPSYDAAGQTLVPPVIHAAMRADPLFVEALDAVRKNAAKNSNIGAQSDRSVAVYDAVKQELRQRSRNAFDPANPEKSKVVSSATGSLATQVKNTAIMADRQAVGPFQTGHPNVSNYEQALADQARLRRQHLEPLQRGPLGRIADTPETSKAIDALFPRSPEGGTAAEVSIAVSALYKRSPWAATQLVRARVEGALNQAYSKNVGGASQDSAGKFAKDLIGHPEEHAVIKAAIEALPQGQARWAGMNSLLEVAQATGKRLAQGSPTAFTDADLKGMAGGGVAAGVVKLGASPGEWWSVVNKKWSAWQAGEHLNDIARIATDPKSAELLGQLSKLPTRSTRGLYHRSPDHCAIPCALW